MPYPATAFSVLIASPSDVPGERQAVADCLHAWNALNAQESSKVLLPVMWESHSAPSMSDRPQEIINEQMVRSCDMLIGVFWKRLGSPTGKAASGTIEEINWFLRQKKPVMLYFSRAPIDPENIDFEQLKELNSFEESIKTKGLFENYGSTVELQQKLSRQITIIMRETNITSVVDNKAVRRAIAQEKADESNENEDKIYLKDYTDKSFIVVGNTLAWKDQLKEAGGSWIKTKHGFSAWCFSKKKQTSVASILGIESDLRTSS